ncbi:MAG TPA: hypothetical protein VGD78_06000 [Chthoniobacterales bacterium]
MRFKILRRSALRLAAFLSLLQSVHACDINEWQYETDKLGGRIRWMVTKSGSHHEFALKNIGSTWVTIDGIYVNNQRVSWEAAGSRIGPSGRYASEGDKTRWTTFTATLPCQFRVEWHSNLAWNEPFGLKQPNFVSAVGDPMAPTALR